MPADGLVLTAAERHGYERNVRLYYVFKFLSEAWLLLPVWVAYLLLERDLSVGEMTLIEAPFWLAVALSEMPTGAVADRWGRRTSLILGAITTALAIFAFGLATTLPLILVSYLVWAIAWTFTSGADNALLYDSLKQLGREDEFERIAGRGAAVLAAGLVIATLAGGPVAAAIGLQETVFLSAATMGLVAATAALFREPPHRAEGEGPQSYLRGIRDAASTVRARPPVATIIPLGAILMAGTVVLVVLSQPFLLSHGYEVGWEFSVLQLPFAATGIAGGLLAFQLLRRAGMPGTMGSVVAIVILAYAGAALWDSVGSIAFLALIPLARSITQPVTMGYINHRVPSRQRATVLSLDSVAFSLVLAPVMPILGFNADGLSLTTAFAVAAGLIGGLALLTGLLWLRAHRAHPLKGESTELPPVVEHAMAAPLESGPEVAEEDALSR